MVCSTVLSMVLALGCSCSPSFTVFVILRFWIGTTIVTTQIAMCVYSKLFVVVCIGLSCLSAFSNRGKQQERSNFDIKIRHTGSNIYSVNDS